MPDLYKSETWLRLRYVSQGKTVTEIAAECGCSPQTIQNHLEKLGLIRNKRTWGKKSKRK